MYYVYAYNARFRVEFLIFNVYTPFPARTPPPTTIARTRGRPRRARAYIYAGRRYRVPPATVSLVDFSRPVGCRRFQWPSCSRPGLAAVETREQVPTRTHSAVFRFRDPVIVFDRRRQVPSPSDSFSTRRPPGTVLDGCWTFEKHRVGKHVNHPVHGYWKRLIEKCAHARTSTHSCPAYRRFPLCLRRRGRRLLAREIRRRGGRNRYPARWQRRTDGVLNFRKDKMQLIALNEIVFFCRKITDGEFILGNCV